MWFKSSNLKNGFLRDVLDLTSGYAISQVIIVLFSPLLTRLYSPSEFGIFFFFITTASILSVISTGAYEKSIIAANTDAGAKELFNFAFILTTLITFLSIAILILLRLGGDTIFEDRTERSMLWLVPFYSFFLSLFRILQNHNIRKQRFKAVASSFIMRSSSQSLTQAGFGAAAIGSPGLIIGSCLGQMIPVFTEAYGKKLFARIFGKSNIIAAFKRAREYSEYPFFRMPTDLMIEAGMQAPVYVLKTIFSDAITGLYTFPQKILFQPSKFISQAVGDVFFRRASDLNSRNERTGELTFRTYRNLFIIGILPYMAIVLWGPQLFSLIFSKEWEASGKIAAWLSPWMFLVFVGSPISSIFIVNNKLGLSFILNLLLLSARISSLLTGALIFRDAELTIILFSMVSVIYWIVSITYSLSLSHVNLKKTLIFTISVIILALILLLPFKIFLA